MHPITPLSEPTHTPHELTVTVFDTVDSTNRVAKEEAAKETPSLYVARTQTAGRGRLGRSFHSPAHTGLYMTVAYTTHTPLTEAVGVTAAAAVAAATAIEDMTPKRPAVKWVNDLYLDGKKLGGILTEAVTRPDGSNRMIVGLGINLTTVNFPEGMSVPATCLFGKGEAPDDITAFADALASEIARRLLNRVAGEGGGLYGEACLHAYRRRLLYVGEEVLCTQGSRQITGTLLGVDDRYGLLLRTTEGDMTLSSGEISLRPLPRF